MKKQLKLMSLLLSIALLLISAAPLTANAFDSIDADATVELITPSEDAIYSVYGSAAPVGLCQELAALDVTITNNTLIEVVPFSNGASGTALEVTNENGSSITKDLFISISNNGIVNEILPIANGQYMPMDGSSVNFPSESDPLVHVTAVYNVYRDYYYQPQAVMMICYGGTITDVNVKYICQGYETSYPGFEDLSEDNFDVFQHIVTLIEYSPTNNTIYHRIREYRSDRVLQARYGNPNLGQSISFSGYVNGTWVSRERGIAS